MKKTNQPNQAIGFDFETYLSQHREWSQRTFGPHDRRRGLIQHIRKELLEIEREPDDIEEWIDLIILGIDGAQVSGANPRRIIEVLQQKQTENLKRAWPDWRTIPTSSPIEHIRDTAGQE